MRQAVLIFALLLVPQGCDRDYDPHHSYKVCNGCGGIGLAYGTPSGATSYTLPEEDVTQGADAIEEVSTDFKAKGELFTACTETYADYPNVIAYCNCVVQGGNEAHPSGMGKEYDFYCDCAFNYCVPKEKQAINAEKWPLWMESCLVFWPELAESCPVY